jgi:transposase
VRLALEKSVSVACQTFDIADSTVRDWVRRHRSGEPLSGKKRGRPQHLSAEVEKAVDDAVMRLRHVGGTVQASTIQALATTKSAELLPNHFRPGDPVISTRTAHRVAARLKLSYRKVTTTTKPPEVQAEGDAVKTFRLEVDEIKNKHSIPPHLVLNFDEVGLRLVPTSSYTYESTGARQVAASHQSDKRQVTVVLGTSMGGGTLPPQIVYEGKTLRCHPTGAPEGWHLTHSRNHWATSGTTMEYAREILLPHIRKFRGTPEQHSLVIYDAFSGHLDPAFAALLAENNVEVVQVPPGATSAAQPNDAGVNRAFKARVRQAFMAWFTTETARLSSSGAAQVDTRMVVIKNLHLQWVRQGVEHLLNSPEIVRRSWRSVGLLKD